MFQTSCYDLLLKSKNDVKILTGIEKLDEALGGGLYGGTVTELCGSICAGKTQLCLQFCLNVQLPQYSNVPGSKAIYIDTKQDFSIVRLKELIVGHKRRFPAVAAAKLLEGVSYVFCKDYLMLLATIINLGNIFEVDSNYKLVVIDSFTAVMRILDDVSLRTKIIYEMMTYIHQYADKYNVAFVLTNELSVKPMDKGPPLIRPSLGETFFHKSNQRLLLKQDEQSSQLFYIKVLKCSLCEQKVFAFKVIQVLDD